MWPGIFTLRQHRADFTLFINKKSGAGDAKKVLPNKLFYR